MTTPSLAPSLAPSPPPEGGPAPLGLPGESLCVCVCLLLWS
ncbi:MAG: hypothetical protein P4L40_17355 [Terracidiphilus sp.]|nr:hypothetical protein [Terracidiphilus sp.]